MPRYLTLSPHLTTEELYLRFRASHDPVERSHYQILWRLSTGARCSQVAAETGYSAKGIRRLVGHYNAEGPPALVDHRHASPGRTPLLDAAGMAALREALTRPAPDGGVWSGPRVAQWMSTRLGRPVSNYRGWAVLRRATDTRQVPGSRAMTADPAAQEAVTKGARPRASHPPDAA